MLQVILKINNPILSEKDDAIQQKGREKIIFPQYNWFVIKVWKAIKGMHQTIFKGLWLFKNTFGNIIVLITSLLPLNLLLLTNDTNELKFYNLFQLKHFYSWATCKKLDKNYNNLAKVIKFLFWGIKSIQKYDYGRSYKMKYDIKPVCTLNRNLCS